MGEKELRQLIDDHVILGLLLADEPQIRKKMLEIVKEDRELLEYCVSRLAALKVQAKHASSKFDEALAKLSIEQ